MKRRKVSRAGWRSSRAALLAGRMVDKERKGQSRKVAFKYDYPTSWERGRNEGKLSRTKAL